MATHLVEAGGPPTYIGVECEDLEKHFLRLTGLFARALRISELTELTSGLRNRRGLPLADGPVLVPKDPSRGQRPVPERPCESAMSDFLGERGRRNGENRALGVSRAVAAHPAGDHPRQRATTSGTHHQQVTRAAGNAYQDPACRASLYMRLHHRIVRDFSPDCGERIPETPAGHVLPELAQVARRLRPGGAITLRRLPCNDGYQDRIMGAGQNLRVAQRPQAAGGTTRPNDYAIYARHGVAPCSRLAGRIPLCIRSAKPAVLRPAALSCSSPAGRPTPGCAQPVTHHRATGCMPSVTSDGEAPTEAFWPLISHPWRTIPNVMNVCRPGFPAHPSSKLVRHQDDCQEDRRSPWPTLPFAFARYKM